MDSSYIWGVLSVEPDQVQRPEDDIETLWSQYYRRQRLLADIVRGEMHPDDLLDCLIDDGISPDDYLDAVDEGLAEVI